MQSHSTFESPNGTSSARWPIANDGSVPIPTSSCSSRIAFVWSAASSSSVVQRWPSRPTYCRWSVQIGHDGGWSSRSANWAPHVTQTKRSMRRTLRRDSYGGPTRGGGPRAMRARLLVPLALLALAAFPAAARATSIGLSDQDPAAFSDARLRALHLGYARLVVPWDGASTEPARVQAWLGAVAAAGLKPHVAFEHARGTQCPAAPCTAPSRT